MKRPPVSKGTAKRLLKTLFGLYKGKLIAVFACILVQAIIGGGAIGIMMQQVIDHIEGVTDMAQLSFVFKLVGIMGALFAVGIAATALKEQLMAYITQSFLNYLRKDLFGKMQRLPIRYFDRKQSGEIMSVYTNDIDAIRQLVSQSIPMIVTALITVLTVIVVMASYSIYLLLITLGAAILMALIASRLGMGAAKYFRRQQESMAKLDGYVEEMTKGQKVIKVFTHEEESKAEFDKVVEGWYVNARNAHRYANILMPIMGNMGYLLYVILAIVGASFILLGDKYVNVSLRGLTPLTVGVIASFLQQCRSFSQNIGNVSQQLNSIAMGLAGAERVFKMMDEEPEKDDGYVHLVYARYDEEGNLVESDTRTGIWAWRHPHKAEGTVTYQLLQGDIEMHDVDFGYVPDKIVLHDVSLHAHPGEKYAFVGATGAGKTTITNLLNRFYDIADGKIRYDGININKICKPDLRRSLGMVLQDTTIFSGTVADNIRYGRLDATDEEIEEAAKLADAHDFITRLPQGYQTMLEADGANLSQGQRQLIAIARAAVADAPVMIMDEATSSIDTRTELLVQRGTDKLMHGRTVFVIAHRLSTVQNSDTIMVLDHGRVIERGSHDQLIANKGIYYQLYTGAFELE
ncbi:MAG: ABC transporter ATP-binding protein [Clostridia bacterium]|nr:ABC transporter ATP-binding protein [Clostridia bacterium]